jgi:murein DD-endopeptidase MepM/ murein hydrolase activator NlpD
VASQRSLNHLIASQRTVTKQTITHLIANRQIVAERPIGKIRNPERSLQEPQVEGALQLPAPPVADAKANEPSPVKVATNFVRATRRTAYSDGGWATPKSVSYKPSVKSSYSGAASSYSGAASSYSGAASSYSGASSYFSSGRSYFSGTEQTTPSGLSYYNLTARPAAVPNLGKSSFMFPLAIPAAITSVFGWRMHPITGEYRYHAGTDLGAPQGTPVVAAASGQVATADFIGGYGLTVILQHEKGTQESLYGHLSEIFVRPGDQVEQGTVIGRVGSTGNSTGPHLHFEWRHQTANGWVAVDAGAHLEYSLAQFINALKLAQASTPRGF